MVPTRPPSSFTKTRITPASTTVWTICTTQASTMGRREKGSRLDMRAILLSRAPMRGRCLTGPPVKGAKERRGLGVAELVRDLRHALARLLQSRQCELAPQRILDRAIAGAFLAQPAMQRARRQAQHARRLVEAGR